MNSSSSKIDWRYFLYGGAASCIAEIGTFPIDTSKTRLQIQGQQSIHLVASGVNPVNRSKYKGMVDTLIRISKEEGAKALYRGVSPALLRQSIYGTLKFGIYYSIKKVFPQEYVWSNAICAVFAGMLGSAIANPTDVLKVRMQVAHSSGQFTSLFSSFRTIYKYEGLRGLWRGVGPTSQRAAIIAAVELPVYDYSKKYFIEHGLMDNSAPNHIVSSFIASLAAVITSTPNDVIRTRLMSQKIREHHGPSSSSPSSSSQLGLDSKGVASSNSNPTISSTSCASSSRIYKSSFECFKVTLKHEGVTALYKGFIPAWMRMCPWNIIFFFSYEQLLRLY